MTLADKIIKERKKKGWSQEELAEKVNVSRQAVSKWEAGQSTPDLDKILQISFFAMALCRGTRTPMNRPLAVGERVWLRAA